MRSIFFAVALVALVAQPALAKIVTGVERGGVPISREVHVPVLVGGFPYGYDSGGYGFAGYGYAPVRPVAGHDTAHVWQIADRLHADALRLRFMSRERHHR